MFWLIILIHLQLFYNIWFDTPISYKTYQFTGQTYQGYWPKILAVYSQSCLFLGWIGIQSIFFASFLVFLLCMFARKIVTLCVTPYYLLMSVTYMVKLYGQVLSGWSATLNTLFLGRLNLRSHFHDFSADFPPQIVNVCSVESGVLRKYVPTILYFH